jgi:hypothetical protein
MGFLLWETRYKSSDVSMQEWLFYHSVRHRPGQRLGSTPRRYGEENLLSAAGLDEACIEILLVLQHRAVTLRLARRLRM